MCRGGGVPVQSVRGRAARVGGWHRAMKSVVAASATTRMFVTNSVSRLNFRATLGIILVVG